MRLFKNFSDDFENRILSGKLDDLSKEELQQLEAEGISLKELQSIKATLIALEDLETETELPSASLKDSLLAAFDEEPKKRGRIVSMPIWITAGISIAAIFAIAFMLYNPHQNEMFNKQPVAQKTEVRSSDSYSAVEEQKSQIQEEQAINTIVAEDLPLRQEESPIKNIEQLEVTGSSISDVEMPMMEDAPASLNSAPEIAQSEKMSRALNSASTSTSHLESKEINSNAPRKKVMDQVVQNQKSIALSQMPNVLDKLITVY